MDELHKTLQDSNFHIRNLIATIAASTVPQ
jgi:hypothetical protein